MARIKINDALEQIDHELKIALKETIRKLAPDADLNYQQFNREFKRALRRRITWAVIPDEFIE